MLLDSAPPKCECFNYSHMGELIRAVLVQIKGLHSAVPYAHGAGLGESSWSFIDCSQNNAWNDADL